MVSHSAMKRLPACLLTLGIILAIVADSTDFFFHRPYYEYWDLAANSLDVNRAKHFSQIYGAYSRWGFNHPGPAPFYFQALGEWLFYDVLHLTPAPFNAQTLANLCVTTSYFVAALTVFSRWLSVPARRWFVAGALAVAALHFGNVDRIPSYNMLLGSSVFTSAWTAHNWVFPFLCVLVAGASVANGRGTDLPLLALADGFILHAHISSPLFVGPPTLLAYAGLLSTAIRRERAMSTMGEVQGVPTLKRPLSFLGAAWRAFPQVHLITVIILAVFALPMVIDLCKGTASNFHLVLQHIRYFHGKHKSFARAVFYFLQYGAYRPYKTRNWEFTRFDTKGLFAYLWYHKKIYTAWSVGVFLLIWTCALRPTLVWRGWWREDEATKNGYTASPGRTRYLAWCGGFLLLSIICAVYWGVIQDGLMMYYSGWLTYAIYYFGLLIVLGEFSSVIAEGIPRWQGGAFHSHPAWPWVERLLPVGVVALVCWLEAGRFRVSDPSPETNRAMHDSIIRVIQDAKTRNPQGIKILEFPYIAWPAVTALALEMEREGYPFKIATALPYAFPPDTILGATTPKETQTMELWHFTLGDLFRVWMCGVPEWGVPRGVILKRQMADAQRDKSSDANPMFYPMVDDIELRIALPRVNPNDPDGAFIDMRRGKGSPAETPFKSAKRKMYAVVPTEFNQKYPGCALCGFSDAEPWGTWNLGHTGVLRMRGEPISPLEDVEIHLDAHPFLAPKAHLLSQRMKVSVNGALLGPETRLTKDEDVIYIVPSALWNRTFGQSAGAAMEFFFPDVASPSATDPADEPDGRQLSVGFRGIRFCTVPAERLEPAIELGDSGHPVEINFKTDGNASTFESAGWWDAEPSGTWSRGHTSELHFHSQLVDNAHDVEIALNIHDVMATDSPIKGQRIRASLGSVSVDREHTVQTAGKLVLTVPAPIWNMAVAADADAMLKLSLPDAVSPARIDPTGKEDDERQLAIRVEGISFRKVPTPTITVR